MKLIIISFADLIILKSFFINQPEFYDLTIQIIEVPGRHTNTLKKIVGVN